MSEGTIAAQSGLTASMLAGKKPTPPTFTGTPTALDIKLLPKVLSIIEKVGKEAVFSIYSEEYDPTTGENVQGSAWVFTEKIIPPYPYESKLVDGDLIRDGDMRSGIAGSGIEFTPKEGIIVEFDSQIWKIVKVNSIYSGERVALYELQLRK